MEYVTRLFVKYSCFTEIIFMNNNTDPCSSVFISPGKFNVTLAVRRLNDYLRKIKENFIINKDAPWRRFLLEKPADITDAEAVNLANKITLFTRLLHFSHSILRIFKEVKTTNIISDYIRGIDLSNAELGDFDIDRIRNILIGICRQHIPSYSHPAIIHLIDREYKELSFNSGLKNITFFAVENENNRRERMTEDEKNKISQGIQKAREEIHVEFDL